jgi:hypothetical protein
MSQLFPFIPKDDAGVLIAPTTTSAFTALASEDSNQVVITNKGTVYCYVKLVLDSGTASAANYICPPNGLPFVITSNKLYNGIVCISESGTGALHVIPGKGY